MDKHVNIDNVQEQIQSLKVMRKNYFVNAVILGGVGLVGSMTVPAGVVSLVVGNSLGLYVAVAGCFVTTLTTLLCHHEFRGIVQTNQSIGELNTQLTEFGYML